LSEGIPHSAVDSLAPEHGHPLALGRLARGALHELANGSTAIRGLAELALAADTTSPRLREHLQLIRDSAAGEAELVAALRALSRSEEPAAGLDLAAHAGAAARAVRATAGRHVELEERYEGAPAVDGVPARLERLVVHLLLDACEALPDGGTVRLRVDGAALSVEAEPHAGLPLRPRGSTGLGLAQPLAAALGGTVERREDADVVRLPASGSAR